MKKKSHRKLEDVVEILRKALPRLREMYHVQKLGVFGSVARNEGGKNSDIDILVEFNEPVGLVLFMQLEFELSALLHTKIDLVTPKALKSYMKDQIFAELINV